MRPHPKQGGIGMTPIYVTLRLWGRPFDRTLRRSQSLLLLASALQIDEPLKSRLVAVPLRCLFFPRFSVEAEVAAPMGVHLEAVHGGRKYPVKTIEQHAFNMEDCVRWNILSLEYRFGWMRIQNKICHLFSMRTGTLTIWRFLLFGHCSYVFSNPFCT